MSNRGTTPRGDGDLDTRAKVHDLVVDFYREVSFDDRLGPVFNDVAEVDWPVHIPKLIDYWCRVLLGEVGYDGYILGPHARVDALEPFRAELFDRWYALFETAVDAGWSGPLAERAKDHAVRMSGVLSRRLTSADWSPPTR